MKQEATNIDVQKSIIMLVFMLVMACSVLVAQDEIRDNQVRAGDNDTLNTVEEGFSGATNSEIDYDALVKELYGEEKQPDTTASIVADPIPAKRRERTRTVGPAPGLMKNSVLHGSHISINGSSPFAVADPLYSWYSYIDASVTFKIPYEIYVESIPLYLLFEISTFSFENTHPEGGTFAGISYIAQASSIGDNSGAAIGFGFWDASMGSMLELNYRFRPTKNTFLRFGTRGVLITEIDPLGSVWWLELRVSTGLEL